MIFKCTKTDLEMKELSGILPLAEHAVETAMQTERWNDGSSGGRDHASFGQIVV
jgi:hypothetical protein